MTARGRDGGRPTPPAGPRGMGLTALRDRITEVITPVAGEAGFDLERVIVSRVGRRHRVQVVVDRDDGVGLDAIAEVSRAVSTALDAADGAGAVVVPGEYVLEVSSPGVDRPLAEPRHWRRSVGRLVSVPVAGEGQVTGRVRAAGTDQVTLEVEGSVRTLRYGQLGAGRVQVELRRLDEAEFPAGSEADVDDAGGTAAGEPGADREGGA